MLYSFEVALSDVDRGLYLDLNFRISQHPSEIAPYLLTRALAYCLSYSENLEFSPQGLGDPEAPALQAKDAIGGLEMWIEIGNPSSKKLHKASKAARQVAVYTYKNPDLLIKELASEKVHRADELQIFALDPKFLEALEGQLGKKCRWTILHQEGHLDIDTGSQTFSTDMRRLLLPQ